MRVSYSPGYYVPLPEGHVFPMGKFPALHRILHDECLITGVVEPEQAAWADLRLVHHTEYLRKLEHGTLSPKEERKLGLPWSPQLIYRSRLAVQGTINAMSIALEDGIGANLAGGTHHTFPDHGEGFCVLNDVAVAIRVHQRADRIKRALVIDLDVHQGNGTAAIFEHDATVYTFSMHGARNYPFHKQTSSRDVGLPDGADDDAYLSLLSEHLPTVFAEARADIVLYLAGVDIVRGDRFGRLNVTRQGLHERERTVLQAVRRAGLPVTLLMSGGYAKTPALTADLHAEAHRAAHTIFG
ncbi:MAG: histone deacetylase [Chloroflexi bacterium]|nr:histone deacetylase [Chloroflexota bacterium]